MTSLLFNSGFLRDALEARNQEMFSEIARVPEAHAVEADEGEWATALAERHQIEPPVLQPEQRYMDPPAECKLDMSWDVRRVPRPGGGPIVVPGYRTSLHIPVTGEIDACKLQPSQYNRNPPVGNVFGREVVWELAYPADSPLDLGRESDVWVGDIQMWLRWVTTDIEGFNAGLLNRAQMAIRTRTTRILEHLAHVEATGLPIGPPRDDSKTYIPEVVVRRPSPVIPARTEQPLDLEPVLKDEIYTHILSVIRQHNLSMEQSPGTFAGLGEEDLRQLIRAALNTHYLGAASAEAFNFRGKTDIYIDHEGRSLFIAECKFWSGPKGFAETLDQLFGYQAWRDSKLAVIMFVRSQGFSEVVEKGREVLGSHPRFLDWRDAGSESELRAIVQSARDERRHADLNVFFVPIATS
jgi:hypothetical protein